MLFKASGAKQTHTKTHEQLLRGRRKRQNLSLRPQRPLEALSHQPNGLRGWRVEQAAKEAYEGQWRVGGGLVAAGAVACAFRAGRRAAESARVYGCSPPSAAMKEAASTSCSVSGPSSTARARRHHIGT
jgi:hypothetical protein